MDMTNNCAQLHDFGLNFASDSVRSVFPVGLSMSLFESSRFARLTLLLCLLSMSSIAFAAVNDFDKPILHPDIPLLDENGQHVLNSGKPYSTRMSCGNGEGGGCHDIDKISNSYHFDMGRSEADDHFGKKRGVLPVVSPGYFGGFNCMLANNPLWLSKKSNASANQFLDYGAAGLIKTCGGCHNGGGFAEKDRNGNRYDQTPSAAIQPLDGDYFEWQSGNEPTAWDWKKSGVVEPDCLLCHADFSQLKAATPTTNRSQLACQGMNCSLTGVDQWTELRANMLLKNGHFRDANSAIFSFLDIDPGPDEKFLLTAINNPSGSAAPTMQWNPAAFDANKKMTMPMLRFPASDNCMLCHNTSNQRRGFYGFGADALVETDGNGDVIPDFHDDVHKGKTWHEKGENRDIENCNACHSKQYYKAAYLNIDLDADHNFPMGNADQDVRRDLNYQPEPMSCEHCHGGTAYGSSETPALPHSGENTLLKAHVKLWKDNGDMFGYQPSAYNRTVQVHFDDLACQVCHIPEVKDQGDALKIRYRTREAEDGKLKKMPYLATPRFYWWDKVNQRVVSRRERLQAGAGETPPQTYDEVKQAKAALDGLLVQKGYAGASTQLVWTESNDYLLSHNTKTSKATMPCDDCHSRSAGKVSSALTSTGVLGNKNLRVVASMADKTAYQRLVDEGLVKLDMAYYEIDSNGRIVENVKVIVAETAIEPFTSALRAQSQPVTAGEFRQIDEAELNAVLENDSAAINAAKSLSEPKSFLFRNRIAGDKVKDVALVLGYDKTTSGLLPNYRLELAARNWTSMTQRVSAKKVKAIKNTTIKQGKLAGTTSSSLFDLQLTDALKQPASLPSGHKILLKLPYTGIATKPEEVGVLAVNTESGGVLIKKNPLAPVSGQVVSVMTGSYVTVLVDRLPEHVLVYDLKLKKKK